MQPRKLIIFTVENKSRYYFRASCRNAVQRQGVLLKANGCQ